MVEDEDEDEDESEGEVGDEGEARNGRIEGKIRVLAC